MKKSSLAKWVLAWVICGVVIPAAAGYAGALNRPAAVGSKDMSLGGDPDGPFLPTNLGSRTQLKDPLATAGVEVMVPRFKYEHPIAGAVKSKNMAHLLPFVRYGQPINDWLAFGMDVNTPFGLGAAFEKNPQQLGFDTRSLIALTNVTPSLAFELTDWLSLGAGLSVGYAMFRYDAPLDYDDIPLPVGTKSSAEGFGLGGHFGLLAQPAERFYLGVNYATEVKADLEGETDIRVGLFKTSDDFDSSFTFPGKLDLSAAYRLTDRWLVTAEYCFYNYSKTPNDLELAFCNLPMVKVSHLHWRDNYAVRIGTSYKINDRFTIRGGTGYMSAAVPDGEVNTLTVDGSGMDAAAGVSYHFSETAALDLSATYGWADNHVGKGLLWKEDYEIDVVTFAATGTIRF